MLSPIALFVYNRPWHTRQTVEALASNSLANQSDLIVFSDGPKNQEDEQKVEEVRDYIDAIKGFKSVSIIKSENNKGLANSIISGVTQVVNQYGKIIVLEDDLITSPAFLEYMNQGLDIYCDERAVIQISGYIFPASIKSAFEAFFLPMSTTWGWATWSRAWKEFDPGMSSYEKLKNNEELQYKFNLNGTYPYFKMLTNQRNGKIDSWGIRWYLTTFMINGLTLYPNSSLVKNIGFDNSGTHCGSGGDAFKTLLSNAKINSFPDKVEENTIAMKEIIKYLKRNYKRSNNLFGKLKNILLKLTRRDT